MAVEIQHKLPNGTEDECLFSIKFLLGFDLFDSLKVCIMSSARSYYFFSNVLFKYNFLVLLLFNT